IERARKAAKELGHREVGFPVAVVHRRIEQHRRPAGHKAGIAAPQVAMHERRLRSMACQQFLDIRRGERKAILARERELRLEAALDPELRPALAPAVRLRRRADEIVTGPAEAIGRFAMQRSEHGPERGEIAAAAELEKLHQPESACIGPAVRNRLWRRAARGTQRRQAVGFGGEGVGEACFVQLEEHRLAAAQGAVAAMDAAPAYRLRGGDAPRRENYPPVRRGVARVRRSTRMPMKARSNLLRQEMLACSRSATRMRRMRDSAPAATVAPRCWPVSER